MVCMRSIVRGGGKTLEKDCQPVCPPMAHLFNIRSAWFLGETGNVSWIISEVH